MGIDVDRMESLSPYERLELTEPKRRSLSQRIPQFLTVHSQNVTDF